MTRRTLEQVAEEILEHAKRTGTITIKLREDLASALGHPRSYARGKWYGHNHKPDLYMGRLDDPELDIDVTGDDAFGV